MQNKSNKLIIRIAIGLVIGIVLGVLYNSISGTNPDSGLLPILDILKIFGLVFVSALKGIAPILVLILVTASLANYKKGEGTTVISVIKVYLIATFTAAVLAVVMSYLFPITLSLSSDLSAVDQAPPASVLEVLKTTILNVVDNPVNALLNGNYLGVLFWSVLLGLGLRHASDGTKNFLNEIADGVGFVVKKVISFAPFGIFGLVFTAISENGLSALLSYSRLIIILVSTMLLMVFVVNAFITYLYTKQNPYPLILKVLKSSGITAFFTRSSSANIPINLELCKELDVDPDLYNVTIPLGSTINMSGAAITITIMSLAAANTQGLVIPIFLAFILCFIAAISACGASGVAGGSLLLIPLGCSLLGVDQNTAMEVVGVGFIISIVQDSFETALNSSSDALFTIIVDKKNKLKSLNNK